MMIMMMMMMMTYILFVVCQQWINRVPSSSLYTMSFHGTVTAIRVVYVVLDVFFGLVSGCVQRAGYETNDEEKRKKKFEPASVKEPTSHTRLNPASWINHPSGESSLASSIQWDRSFSNQNLVLMGLPPLLTASLHSL